MDNKKAIIVYRVYSTNATKPKKTPFGLILHASSDCSIQPSQNDIISTDVEFIGLPSKCALRILPLLPPIPNLTYRNTYMMEHRHVRILVTNTNEKSNIEIKKGDSICYISLERNIDDVFKSSMNVSVMKHPLVNHQHHHRHHQPQEKTPSHPNSCCKLYYAIIPE